MNVHTCNGVAATAAGPVFDSLCAVFPAVALTVP